MAPRLGAVLKRLPPLSGAPVRLFECRGLQDRRGEVHAGAFLRQRRIAFNCHPREFSRIFTHEVFHFVWLRLGNGRRRSFERLLDRELAQRARGEVGWSAEWRKVELGSRDAARRTRRWRDYCCESFCDTAAWLYSGRARHGEVTLARGHRDRRRRWFQTMEGDGFSI